jgi:hypothetical protein
MTRPPDRSGENRRFIRLRPSGLVPRTAKIIISVKSPAIDCDVLDISAGGAQVLVHGTTEIPERITFLHSGMQKRSRVVWRKGRRMGLQF